MRRLITGVISLAVVGAVALVLGIAASTADRSSTAGRSRGRRGPVAAASAQPAVLATNRLALALLDRLDVGGNVVLSPYSIETALAMVDQGAAGKTATQIGNTLGDRDAAELAGANAALSRRLAGSVDAGATPSGGAPTLESADGLWLASEFVVKPAFTESLASDFGAAPVRADFADAPAAASAAINSWVSARTAGLIPQLMPPDSISTSTDLVLADALYLKALWATAFDPSMTAPGSFDPVLGSAVQAPFMNETAVLPYTDGSGYRAIELPYRHSMLALLAVMPTLGTLPQFERQLTQHELSLIVGSLRQHLLRLGLPKLHLSVQTPLNGVLASLGMPIAFSNRADFSGISAGPELALQAVEHAAVLKLDEAGTVAAAATGISVGPTAIAAPPSTSLRLDHPFLLFVRDTTTGTILFAARVENPLLG